MAEKQIHVRIHDRRWGVFQPGDEEPKSSHDVKADAIAAARELAAKHEAEVVVFGLDGRQQ